jgi:hypothetical protein
MLKKRPQHIDKKKLQPNFPKHWRKLLTFLASIIRAILVAILLSLLKGEW